MMLRYRDFTATKNKPYILFSVLGFAIFTVVVTAINFYVLKDIQFRGVRPGIFLYVMPLLWFGFCLHFHLFQDKHATELYFNYLKDFEVSKLKLARLSPELDEYSKSKITDYLNIHHVGWSITE